MAMGIHKPRHDHMVFTVQHLLCLKLLRFHAIPHKSYPSIFYSHSPILNHTPFLVHCNDYSIGEQQIVHMYPP